MSSPTLILVVDLGTTSLRCSIVDQGGTVLAHRQSTVPEIRDADGLAWDGGVLAAQVLADAQSLAQDWQPNAVAIANQRTTALVWDAQTGVVQGPVLSWSDNRTITLDRDLRAQGVRMIAGLSASKWRWLLDACDASGGRRRAGQLRVGTMDSWLVWVLTQGQAHVTDHTNASHTGLYDLKTHGWDMDLATDLGFPASALPRIIACQPDGLHATALVGAPPILAVIGDQQASLVGQGCEAQGQAKITFGTSGVLNVVMGTTPLANPSRSAFGNVVQSTGDKIIYGAEASVLGAGSAIEWLVRLGVLDEARQIDTLVDPATRSDALFVSALGGIGVPHWQPQARGAFFGLSAAHGPSEMVRAVLDGISAGAAEVVAQAEQATGQTLTSISIDGGMTKSTAFTAILAATLDRPLYLAPAAEATTRGAAILALRALGGAPEAVPPAQAIIAHPDTRPADTAMWRDAVALVLAHTKSRIAAT
ncbi:FGGY family carbohydrate kinase [Yoonia sp. MH D7]